MSGPRRNQTSELPTADSAGPAEQPDNDAVALVPHYIQKRAADQGEGQSPLLALVSDLLRQLAELPAELSAMKDLEQRNEALRPKCDKLKAYSEQLEANVRRLEIGLRRHLSEQVSPDQLRLALLPLATESEQVTEAPEVSTAPDSPPADPSGGDNEDPKGRRSSAPRKQDRHGRRRNTQAPQAVIEVLPAQVPLNGLSRYDRIGQEGTRVMGYRRGGPIEVIFVRGKYVERSAPADATESDATTDTPVGNETSANDETSATGNAGISRLDQALMVPDDTSFKRSPFVDGAIVCYAPPAESPSTDRDPRSPVLIAPAPTRPLERGMADASLIAHILVHKQDYHTPYYRQEVEFQRLGWPISRTNMARWQYESGELLMRLSGAMWQEALARSWFAMDATGTAIRDKKQYRYGHVFVLVAPGDAVLFRFTPKYGADTVEALFGGYLGTIVADASANHNVLFGPGKGREGGCWSHARKPFFKAFCTAEEPLAAKALQMIQALFRLEEQAVLYTPEGRLRMRQEQSAPLVNAFL